MDVGLRHLGVAILEYKPGLSAEANPSIPHVELLAVYDVLQECGSNAKCTGVNKLDMVRLMCQFLHSMETTWDVLHVTDFVVESQVRKSPKNQGLMVTLFAWFYGVHLRQKAQVSSLLGKYEMPQVFQVSAKNKLADCSGSNLGPCTKSSYPQRKKQAIDHMRELVHANEVTITPSWHVRYSMEKKRDDMADAVLQALWYIRHKIRGLPEKGKTKTKSKKTAKVPRAAGKTGAGKSKKVAGKGKTTKAETVQASIVTKPKSSILKSAGKGKGKRKLNLEAKQG